MLTDIDAIYENGLLRPLAPLSLSENERVKLTVARAGDEDWIDTEYMDACAGEADFSITLEQIRAITAKI